MATTTNFGWTTPNDTDLVSQGAAAIRTLGSAIDTSMMDLKGGTTGQVLSKASNTDMDFTWTSETDPTAISKTLLDAKADLITATAADTPARLAVGTDGQVLTADSTQSTGLKWATPTTGLNFTARSFAARFNAIAYNGSNLWVGVGSSGILYSSTDAYTWTSRTSGFGANRINGIAYGAGIWVAVGQNGTITTSTDGTTWTSRTSNMGSNEINAVTFANSTFVAVGAGGGATNTGGITYSTDGITWTRKSQTPTVGTTYYDVGWNGTNWIVSAANSTNNYLYASTPSGAWTAGADGSATTLQGYLWDGTRNYVFTGGLVCRSSTSTTLGTTTAYNYVTCPIPNQKATDIAKIYNNVLYIFGLYFARFNTAIASNINWQPNEIMITPSSMQNIGAITDNVASTWVGAQGIILNSQNGQIWTSF